MVGDSFVMLTYFTTHSNIRAHSRRTNHPMRVENFKIIGRSGPTDNIRLLESVYIRYLNPDLNDAETAMPLNIIWLVSLLCSVKYILTSVLSSIEYLRPYSSSFAVLIFHCLHLAGRERTALLRSVSFYTRSIDITHNFLPIMLYIILYIWIYQTHHFQTSSCLSFMINHECIGRLMKFIPTSR